MAGIVVSASDAKEVVKELEGEKIESQVADLTIMDASNHSVDVTLCGGLASDVSAVVVVVGLRSVVHRVFRVSGARAQSQGACRTKGCSAPGGAPGSWQHCLQGKVATCGLWSGLLADG